jgi:hypothetical protein
MTEGGETRDPFTKKEEHEEEREQEATKKHCRRSPMDFAQIFLKVSRYLHGDFMELLSQLCSRARLDKIVILAKIREMWPSHRRFADGTRRYQWDGGNDQVIDIFVSTGLSNSFPINRFIPTLYIN